MDKSSRQANRLTGITLLAVSSLTIMVGCILLPGLPLIATQLGISSDPGWLITMPSLGVILFGPAAGKLMQKVGAYNALCVGLALYGLIGMAGFLFKDSIFIHVDRLLLGAATAVVMASGTALIAHFYQGQERLQMIAKQGISIEVGGVIFLAVAGLLTAQAWFWPFYLYAIAWLILVMVVLYVPAMTGLEKTQTDTAEVRVSREQRWVLALALISMLIFFITTITLPVQLHQSGVSETTAGFYLAFISFMAVIGAFFMPKVVERLQEKSTLIAAYSLYGIAQILFAFTNSWFTLILAAVAMGMGFGLSIPLVNHITIELSDSSIRNKQLAYLSMAIFSGQFLSSVLAEMIDDHLALYLCTTFLAFITAITLIAMTGLRFRP